MSFFNHQVSQLAANLIFRFQLNKLIELTHGIINTTCAMMIDLTPDCGPVALVGPIAWIGLFEGGYHHALKVILFQLDLPVSTLQRLYPPGIYEPPEDLFFEGNRRSATIVSCLGATKPG
jgi:hypothetical protein